MHFGRLGVLICLSLPMNVCGSVRPGSSQTLSLNSASRPFNQSTLSTSSEKIEKWAETARKYEYYQQPEHQRAIDTLETMFHGNVDGKTAAMTISSVYEPWLIRETSSSPVLMLWVIMCEAITVLGRDKEIDLHLIELINTLSQLPDVIGLDGKPVATRGQWAGFGVFWKDLPVLAVSFRTYAIDIDIEEQEEPDPDEWTDKDIATRLNVDTFGALYLAHGLKDIGMSFHAEVAFWHAFELPYDTPDRQRFAKQDVPQAATWMLLATEKIYDLCKKGEFRYSLEGWTMWKRRFHEIARNTALLASVREIALKAALRMKEVEN